MTKLYSIEYQHLGGQRAKQTSSIFQLYLWLDEAIEDRNIVDGSINLYTTTRKDKNNENSTSK